MDPVSKILPVLGLIDPAAPVQIARLRALIVRYALLSMLHRLAPVEEPLSKLKLPIIFDNDTEPYMDMVVAKMARYGIATEVMEASHYAGNPFAFVTLDGAQYTDRVDQFKSHSNWLALLAAIKEKGNPAGILNICIVKQGEIIDDNSMAVHMSRKVELLDMTPLPFFVQGNQLMASLVEVDAAFASLRETFNQGSAFTKPTTKIKTYTEFNNITDFDLMQPVRKRIEQTINAIDVQWITDSQLVLFFIVHGQKWIGFAVTLAEASNKPVQVIVLHNGPDDVKAAWKIPDSLTKVLQPVHIILKDGIMDDSDGTNAASLETLKHVVNGSPPEEGIPVLFDHVFDQSARLVTAHLKTISDKFKVMAEFDGKATKVVHVIWWGDGEYTATSDTPKLLKQLKPETKYMCIVVAQDSAINVLKQAVQRARSKTSNVFACQLLVKMSNLSEFSDRQDDVQINAASDAMLKQFANGVGGEAAAAAGPTIIPIICDGISEDDQIFIFRTLDVMNRGIRFVSEFDGKSDRVIHVVHGKNKEFKTAKAMQILDKMTKSITYICISLQWIQDLGQLVQASNFFKSKAKDCKFAQLMLIYETSILQTGGLSNSTTREINAESLKMLKAALK